MRSNMYRPLIVVLLALTLMLVGCATTHDRLFDVDTSQVQLRTVQSRAFDTTDKEKTLRAVVATLQDLGFIIDKADATLGLVSATKTDVRPAPYPLKVTVTVRPRGQTQIMVRANAEYQLKPVTDAKPYQQFFSALEKSLFLQAHEVD